MCRGEEAVSTLSQDNNGFNLLKANPSEAERAYRECPAEKGPFLSADK